MRSSINSSLKIKEIGKICFPLGKIDFWIHCEFCVYHRIFGHGKALNIFINYLMFSPSRHVKWKHLSIPIFIQQLFYDEQGANFTVTRNNFGHLICWWVTFLSYRSRGRIWISCWKLFLSFASWVITYIFKMYCSWCIALLGYTCQIRKFEKFINIPSNTKFFRSWITPLQKQPP